MTGGHRNPSPSRNHSPGIATRLRSREISPRRRNFNSHSADRETISVFCRIRHVQGVHKEHHVESSSSQSEDDSVDNQLEHSVLCCKTVDQKTVELTTVDRRKDAEIKSQYSFTQAFNSKIGQKTVFDTTARPMVDRLVEGGNGLLFAYGVTGSGKTYTMMGSKEQPGMLPRTLDMLFSSIKNYQTSPYEIKSLDQNRFGIQSPVEAMQERQENEVNFVSKHSRHKETSFRHEDVDFDFVPCTSDKVNPNARYAVFIQFVEIYNDRVYDLLDDSTGTRPDSRQSCKKVRPDNNGQTYVEGVREVEVKSIEAAFEQYYIGKERRRLAQTELNFSSSRSHSIFQIRLVRIPYDKKSGEIEQDSRLLSVSRLALVDLAGSERVSRTGAQGQILSEASNINTSLMALRRCIEALRKNQRGGTEFIPFRQKKIVFLFKPFFEGEGRIHILICVNPQQREANETEQVLSFAESVKKVQTRREEIREFDIEDVQRRREDLKAQDNAKKEEHAKRVRDLQRTIKGMKAPKPKPSPKPAHTPMDAKQQYHPETDSETGFSSNYTISSFDFHLPESLGGPPPAVDEIDINDEKTFPKVVKWLLDRKEKMQEMSSVLTRAMPVHVQNLKSLISQYDNHQAHFRELNDRFDEQQKENEVLRKNNKRLDAKNITYQKQIGKLERERQDDQINLNEKEVQCRELSRQVRYQRNELESELGKQSRRHKLDTEKAVRQAVAGKSELLKNKEAKLAQLKHVLDKTNLPKENGHRGGPNEAKHPQRRARSPSPEKVQLNSRAPLTGQEKANGVTHNAPLRRRSRSVDANVPYLSHKPSEVIPTKTLLQPNCKVSKHVHIPNVKDLQQNKKYLLTAQNVDSDGEIQTQYLKGDIVRTRAMQNGDTGIAVQFTDVEILKTKDPSSPAVENKPNPFNSPYRSHGRGLSKKRVSDTPLEELDSNAPSQWTDVATRCQTAVQHDKGKSGIVVKNIKKART